MRSDTKNLGFTLVEIIIVIVVLGILTGLVTNAFGGLQDDARDSERKSDLQAVTSELEAYYNDFGMYPTLANYQDEAWVKANLHNLSTETQIDPKGGEYPYTTIPTGCDNLTDATECKAYTLTADTEEDGYGPNDADSNTEDIVELSLFGQ